MREVVQEKYRIEQRAKDFRLARLQCQIANIHRPRDKHGRPTGPSFKFEQFMPRELPTEKELKNRVSFFASTMREAEKPIKKTA